jgi:iron complex transport system substrate-binding protein
MKRLAFLLILLFVLPASAQDMNPCDHSFRLIEHALGETCVPENPQRIVPLDMAITELLLITGIEPVAASSTVLRAHARMHPELEDIFTALMETAADTGFPPNIEVILNSQPDLIIGPRDLFTESLYPQMAEIAPTVLYDPAPGDWQSRLIFAGEVLGLTETVDDLLTEYDARVAELRDLLEDTAGEIEVSLVRTFPGQIGLVLEGTNAAAVLASVGLVRPSAQALDYEYVLANLDGRPELLISLEELSLAEGDVVFVFGDPSELFENPLWNALSAVQDGRAYEVGYYWWGDSLLSAHRMLDDLFFYVAGIRESLEFKEGHARSSTLPSGTFTGHPQLELHEIIQSTIQIVREADQ